MRPAPPLPPAQIAAGMEALGVLKRCRTQVEAERESGISREQLRARVQRLEEHLGLTKPGTRLTDSVQGRGTTVTAAGERLLQAWEPAETATNHVLSLLSKPHIRAFPQHLFPGLLRRWVDGAIDVDIAPENDRLTDRFRERLADIASGLPMIAIGPEVGDLPYGVARHAYYDTPYWVLSSQRSRTCWTFDELRDVDLLLAAAGTRSRDTLDAEAGTPFDPALESFSPMALVKTAYIAATRDEQMAVCLPADIALRFWPSELFGQGIADVLTWAPLIGPDGNDFVHRVFAYTPTHDDPRIAQELRHLANYVESAIEHHPDGTRRNPDQRHDAYRLLLP